MAKADFTTVSPAREDRRKPQATPADRLPLVEFLQSLDLDGLEVTRERDTGRDLGMD